MTEAHDVKVIFQEEELDGWMDGRWHEGELWKAGRRGPAYEQFPMRRLDARREVLCDASSPVAVDTREARLSSGTLPPCSQNYEPVVMAGMACLLSDALASSNYFVFILAGISDLSETK